MILKGMMAERDFCRKSMFKADGEETDWREITTKKIGGQVQRGMSYVICPSCFEKLDGMMDGFLKEVRDGI